MAKTKISEFDSNPANNTDIDSINIAEGCAPSGINNAIRELMSQLKNQQTGADSDNFTVGGNLTVTGTTVHTGATTFTGAVVMSTALPIASGGTGATTAGNARTSLSAAGSGANSDITSITGLTTPLTVAQGGTGAATHTSKGVLIGNGTSAVSTVSPGTSGNVLTSDGTSWTSTAGAYVLTSGTSQASTSGTSIDFTSIPSWVKRITVLFNEVSTTGSTVILIQLGTGGTPTTTGYLATKIEFSSTGIVTDTTNGHGVVGGGAINVASGQVVFCNVSGNIWVGTGSVKQGTTFMTYSNSSVTLGGVLNMLRITCSTDTFDAGSINILYE